MDEFIRIKHSFNAGDLVAALPGLRQLYRNTGKKVIVYQRLNLPAFYYHDQINSTVNEQGDSVCMNLRLFNMMKSLIEGQEYIESFEVWEGQKVDLDYDLSRDTKSIPMPAGLLHTYTEAVFPETSTDLSQAWINISATDKTDIGDHIRYGGKVLINRTQRYVNPYITFYFLKEYEPCLLFSGTEMEHEDFCNKNNLKIELLQAENCLQIAAVIESCNFGLYNQSLHWHIADGLKRRRILEVCSAFPNTFATGKNGYHAFGQAALEYYFSKLINK